MKPALFQHYKGDLYVGFTSADDSNNTRPHPEMQMVYYSLEKHTWHIRSWGEFHGEVEIDGEKRRRFAEVVFPEEVRK